MLAVCEDAESGQGAAMLGSAGKSALKQKFCLRIVMSVQRYLAQLIIAFRLHGLQLNGSLKLRRRSVDILISLQEMPESIMSRSIRGPGCQIGFEVFSGSKEQIFFGFNPGQGVECFKVGWIEGMGLAGDGVGKLEALQLQGLNRNVPQERHVMRALVECGLQGEESAFLISGGSLLQRGADRLRALGVLPLQRCGIKL